MEIEITNAVIAKLFALSAAQKYRRIPIYAEQIKAAGTITIKELGVESELSDASKDVGAGSWILTNPDGSQYDVNGKYFSANFRELEGGKARDKRLYIAVPAHEIIGIMALNEAEELKFQREHGYSKDSFGPNDYLIAVAGSDGKPDLASARPISGEDLRRSYTLAANGGASNGQGGRPPARAPISALGLRNPKSAFAHSGLVAH